MASDPAADRQALAEVIHLGLWHCLCAITRLEVPERLAAGPPPIAQLAVAVGADPDALPGVAAGRRPQHRGLRGRPGRPDRPRPAAVPRSSVLAVGRLRHRRDRRRRPSADRHVADRPGSRPRCWACRTGTTWPPTPTSRRCLTSRCPAGPGAVAGLRAGPGLAHQPRLRHRRGIGTRLLPCSRPPQAPTASWSTSHTCWSVPGPSCNARGLRPLRAVPWGPVRPPTPGRPVSAGQRAARLGRPPCRPHLGGAGPQRHQRHPPADLRDGAPRGRHSPPRAKMSDVLMPLMFDGARERTVATEELPGGHWLAAGAGGAQSLGR